MKFLLEFPRHRYVVTSRSQDELWKRLRTSSEAIKDAVVIQRITDEQARRYLIAHLGDQKGCELHDRLNECLRGLSRTPLLLWMIKEAGLAGEELPGNRGELFDRFVDRILERDEKLEPSVPASAKKRALANLAFDLQQRHQLACTLEHAVEVVDGAVRGYDAEMVLKEILIHGLLQGERQVRFLHQSVQEYFVGLHLCKIAQVERKASGWQRASKRFLRRNLARWARDDWWAESFVQMAGLTDDSSWLARELAPVKPWLAFWCSIEGRPVDKKTKAVVEADTIALLHSKDAERRLRALAELGRFENPRTIEYLIQALEDDADGVVDAAIHILAEQGEPAVEPLLAAVQGGARTRRAATRALGQIWRMPDLVRLGDSDRLTRRAAVEPLGETGNTRVLEPLIAVLKDSDATVRQKATEVLAKSKDARTLKLLIAALEDPDQDMRCSAVEVLGEMGDSRAVEPLIQTVGDQTEPVGRAAVKALGKIGDRRAVGRLITALKYGSSTSTVRREAAEALGKLGDSQAVQPLIDALKDSDESVRRSTIEALGKLGDPRAVRPLIHALGDENELVCQAAVEALGRLGGAAMDLLVTALKDSDRKVREGVAKTLGKIGDIRAVRPLVNVLKDSDERVRQAASDALGKINDVRAVGCLITYLKDSDGNVRSGVAKALGRMGGDRAVPPLAAALEDGDRNVRQSAVEALGNLGGEQVVASLIRALGDRERMVRQAAIDALERVCNAGVMWRLIAGLKSGDKNVRWGTTKVLGSLGDAQAVEPLIAALKDSEGIVRLSAVEALGKLGDARAVKPLISVLEDGDGNVRSGVAKTLGNLGDARAVDPLISALWDGETRVQSAAADALGKLEDVALHRLTALLVRAIRTDNRDMQWSVLEALRRIGTPAARDLVRQYDAEKRRNWKTP
jgi:HEAT repeat protein